MNIDCHKCLEDIRDEFEPGMFLSVYQASREWLQRTDVRCIIGMKQGLRGVLFSQPLYLLPVPGNFQA